MGNFLIPMNILQSISKHVWLIFWLSLFGAVLAFDVSVIQTPQYSATSKILVIQKQTQGQDIYSISKSAQYLTRVLKEGVYSDSFFNQVIGSTDKISRDDFPQGDKEKRKAWEKNIKIAITQDLGVMEITVLSESTDKIKDINQAIANNLVVNHKYYHGAGDNVEVKILDQPFSDEKPATPVLWLNTVIGALIGLLISLLIIFRKNNKLEVSSSNRNNRFSVPRGGF